MKGKIHLIVLGVSDLKRATEFYLALGFKNTEASTDYITFLQLDHALLGLYSSKKLEEDATVPLNHSGHANIALAHNTDSREEVDQILAAIPEPGRVVKPPQEVFWGGYSGYFVDPDDHLWEVSYNPFFSYDDNGNLVINQTDS